ncbi:MAG: exodeoxyribonuclease VII large subunit [Agathobacter sp.]|nr:exodeoxyribonuclease VII large subunit [Agathobacter sp.]
MTKNVYSVGQVNLYIKNMFSQDFMLHQISVKGEVSNCKYHTNGHIYFTIKDAAGAMRAVMFAGNRKGLSFHMKEGDRVIVTGSVEVYERDGIYQMYARQIEADGAGNLFLKFEQLKRELEEMGMFAQEYKQPIPRYIHRLGIVTAPTGAAIQDIRNIATRRNPYVQLILYPALVQGSGAAESIVNGIHALDMLGVDTIIVGRGGGSIEDLWAFNEEIVARAIFDCETPIISAVGHETDTTIADMVADLRAPTPSAAAELAVADVRDIEAALQQKQERMRRVIGQQLRLAREQVNHYTTRLGTVSPQNQLNTNRTRAAALEEKLTACMQKRLSENRTRTSMVKERLNRRMERILEQKKTQFGLLAKQLEGNSPIRKLSQGYAFVEGPDQKTIRSVKRIRLQDEITVQMLDGGMRATVSEVWQNERKE